MWVVNATPRPLYPWERDPVPIVQEAVWAPGPVWTGAVDVSPTGIRSPDRPTRIESLGRLSYPGPLMFGVANVHFSSRIVVEMRFIYFFQNLKCYI